MCSVTWLGYSFALTWNFFCLLFPILSNCEAKCPSLIQTLILKTKTSSDSWELLVNKKFGARDRHFIFQEVTYQRNKLLSVEKNCTEPWEQCCLDLELASKHFSYRYKRLCFHRETENAKFSPISCISTQKLRWSSFTQNSNFFEHKEEKELWIAPCIHSGTVIHLTVQAASQGQLVSGQNGMRRWKFCVVKCVVTIYVMITLILVESSVRDSILSKWA